MSRKRRRAREAGKAIPPPPDRTDRGTGDRTPARLYFWLVIPLLWVLILVGLEVGLRLVGVGYETALFEPVDPGLLVDNTDYTRRFYSLYDRPELVQKSNLFPAEKPPGRLRVFVVGESTAQGFPFQRNHSFTGIAQAGLRAAGVDVEVLNVGNSAMTSYYLREALRDIVAYEPDFVAVYAGHNEYYGTPSMFTGGSHASRLAVLWLRKFRTVQALEGLLAGLLRNDAPTNTLMERRFGEGLFPPDSARDARVAELFLRNLEAGLSPLQRAGVTTAIFEPVSNLIDMPPFREVDGSDPEGSEAAGSDPGDETGPDAGRGEGPLVREYRRLREQRDGGAWDRDAWIALKDRDPVPFRARSALTEILERFATTAPAVTWIDTSEELERAAGPEAFSHSLFIDHLHFNFDGQLLLARMLGEAVLARFYPGDEARLRAYEEYLSDPDRVRADVRLTAFWEFEAYTRIANLQRQEPFASMPLPKASPPVPERVQRNSLFAGGDFIDSLREEEVDDLFFAAIDYYRSIGDRDEWIRNMNAYIHIFAGHHESHLAYGIALLEDGGPMLLDQAGAYIRRAYALSGYDPGVVEVAREALEQMGLGSLWDRFEQTYLVKQ